MTKAIVGLAVGAALLFGGVLALRSLRSGSAPAEAGRWIRTSEGDFEESRVDGTERVRILAATRGTRDDTVKFLGARGASRITLGPEARLAARLDWNKQANGSYLSAGLVLSPQSTEGNPLAGPDWFKAEYVGVPPGENARLFVACRTAGRDRILFTDGWPDPNRKGRKIGLQEIEIVIRQGAVQVLENGAIVYETREKILSFDQGYLYLQMSTHSNYPPREVFFDRIRLP